MKRTKFKRKYVLGEGYPWALGLGPVYDEVRLHKQAKGAELVALAWPDELWFDEVPRYRLVLERVRVPRLQGHRQGGQVSGRQVFPGASCVVCKTGVCIEEGCTTDGHGDSCELSSGSWVCSSKCWDVYAAVTDDFVCSGVCCSCPCKNCVAVEHQCLGRDNNHARKLGKPVEIITAKPAPQGGGRG